MLEDPERDLIKMDHRTEVLTKKCGTEGKVTFKEEGDKGRWFPVETSSAMSEILLPTPTAIGNATLVDHIKQEGQKADDAKVHTCLWSFFFRESFLHYSGSVNS